MTIAAINELFEGITLRDIIKRDEARVRFIPVPDNGVLLDVDTEEDYDKIVLMKHVAGEHLT